MKPNEVQKVNELDDRLWAQLRVYPLRIQGVVISRLIGNLMTCVKVNGDPARTAELRLEILDTMLTTARAQVAVTERARH